MADAQDDDPFTWDVERVVQELCTPTRTWQPTTRAQLPDPHQLATKLRECDYDGELLLDSLDNPSDLWSDLGITQTKIKMAVRVAIQQFRKRSPKYMAYKQSLCNDSDGEMIPKREKRSLSPGHPTIPLPVSSTTMQGQEPQLSSGADLKINGIRSEDVPGEPSKKKRRLASTQLTTVDGPPSRDSHFSAAPISAGADAIMASRMGMQPTAQPVNPANENADTSIQPGSVQQGLLSQPGAFYGNGKLSSFDVVSFDIFDMGINDELATFGWGQPKLFGRARKQYVNGQMKRYFRNPQKFYQLSDDESVLPLLGESDEDDPEWQKILREEEEETVDREQEQELAKPAQLQPDEIEAILQQTVQEYAARWQEVKLPVQQRQAFSLWNRARRQGNRNKQIVALRTSKQEQDARLTRLLNHLKDNTYSTEKELRELAPSLEPTVNEIELLKWSINVLQLREPPEEIISDLQIKTVPRKKRPVDPNDDGIDIWSEDDLDDFIENDDVEDHVHEEGVPGDGSDEPIGDAMDIDNMAPQQSFASTSSGGISMYDLTEVSGTSKDPINLCTPIRPKWKPNGDSPLAAAEDAHGEVSPYPSARGLADAKEIVEDEDDGENAVMTPSQKRTLMRKRKEARSEKLRREDESNSRKIEARKIQFRQRLEDSTLVPKERSRLIINESKEDVMELIFIHNHIAPRIKDHQVDGVRFMWDAVTKKNQGCLLAHTMGLGKTMQVITLLTAIAEASKSEKENIWSQIPRHLRTIKYLILCPAGILNNWVDEIRSWAPHNILGEIFYFQANDPPSRRVATIESWVSDGGVLVMSYSLLRSLRTKRGGQELLRLVQEEPTLVIGDEAHNFKNSAAKIGDIANGFETRSRIALTGSPLANNVQEYYSMINWVSPGFLGDPEEFRRRYTTPIITGLWKDSDAYARRKAKICLAALKKVVAPKMQRKTIALLKGSVPPKKEYIIHVDLTDIQKTIYQVYVQNVRGAGPGLNANSVWTLIGALGLLLAHPTILKNSQQEKRTQKSPNDKTVDASAQASAAVLSSVEEALDQNTHDAIDASHKMLVLDKILEESMRLGENVLVFSQSLLTLNFIEAHLCQAKNRVYKRIDGKVRPALRQGMVKDFNNHRPQVFLISTTAGGVGLNIHGASRVVIFDFSYNPVHEQQAIGRAYRIGQTKPVVVYWLICDGTFEKTMHNQQVFKNQLASRVVDSKAPVPKADLKLTTWFRDYQQVDHEDMSAFRGKDPIMDAILQSQLVEKISSLESTDTFEEEEPDKDLPEDAQNEADAMCRYFSAKTKVPQSGQVRQSSVSNPLVPVLAPHEAVSSAMNAQEEPPKVLAFGGVERSSPDSRATSAPPSAKQTPCWGDSEYASHMGSEWDTPADQSAQVSPDIFSSLPVAKSLSAASRTGATPTTMSLGGQHLYSQTLMSGTRSGQQQPPPSALPLGMSGMANGQNTRATPIQPVGSVRQGINGAVGIQNAFTTPTSTRPPSTIPSTAARPIAMDNTQERSAAKLQEMDEAARIMAALKVQASMANFHGIDRILRGIEAETVRVRMEPLEKRRFWKRLDAFVHTKPEFLTLLGRCPSQLIVQLLINQKQQELADILLEGLLYDPETKERDPDVGDPLS